MKNKGNTIILTENEAEVIFDALADLEAMGALGDMEEDYNKYHVRINIMKRLEKNMKKLNQEGND